MVNRMIPQKTPVRTESDILSLELKEIREITDILARRVDQRMKVLVERETALDARIATMERLIQQAGKLTVPGKGRDLQAEREAALDARIAAMERRVVKTEELATSNEERKRQAEREASMDDRIDAMERRIRKAEELATADERRNRQQEILSLGLRGMRTPEIAQVLSMPAGEVDLVLSLHQQPAGNGFRPSENFS